MLKIGIVYSKSSRVAVFWLGLNHVFSIDPQKCSCNESVLIGHEFAVSLNKHVFCLPSNCKKADPSTGRCFEERICF